MKYILLTFEFIQYLCAVCLHYATKMMKKSKISTHLDNTIFKKENKKNGRSQIIHCYCRKQNVLYIFIKQLIDIKLC